MRTIIGNITDITSGIIVHQVNCRDRIGAGVSGHIIRKWPAVEQAYHDFCDVNEPIERFGKAQFVEVTKPNKFGLHGLTVVNLFSQMNYGNSAKTGVVYTNLEALVKGILKICYQNPKQTVYIPYGLGCGLAGGDWEELSSWFHDVDNLVAVKLP